MGVDGLPVVLTTSGIDIHVSELDPSLALPDPADNVEEDDHRESKVSLEEVLGRGETTADRGDGDEELSGHADEDEEETEVGTIDTSNGLEWDLIEGVALVLPAGAETDVCLFMLLEDGS
tara:strand:- start:471 stop:830 length:360 start_codon:yes stop_codon:yes gene_type:complete